MSCSAALMRRPYLAFLMVSRRAERMQPWECVQKGVCELSNSSMKFIIRLLYQQHWFMIISCLFKLNPPVMASLLGILNYRWECLVGLIQILEQMSKLVQNYLLQQPIGKGVYGQVFRSIHQKSKAEYAVKVIPKASFKANPKLQQLAINEINILSSLRNENIVRFIETLKTPNNFYFVYEYCNGGTLESMLQKKKLLKEEEALVIFRQLLEAFQELNKNSIMHRDLKPDNIFFNDGKVKLGDFGFCKMLEVNMAQTMLGSPIYMAPEILKEEIYTLKADIWSLGVVLFEMLFGYCPFESSSISQLINVIKDNELKIPKDINPISDECEKLIRKMLVKDQFKRIEWVDLFDFKIDEKGCITSGYKKDLGIEALERYFLLDIKGAGEYETGEKQAEPFGESKLERGAESDKLIFSHKELYREGNNLGSAKQISVKEGSHIGSLKEIDGKETTNVGSVKQIGSKETNNKQKDLPQKDFILKSINSEQINSAFTTPTPQKDTPKDTREETESFINKHKRWLKGVQLMDQLSDCSDSKAETIFYYVIVVMLKEVTEQYQDHPEWTDVLIEQKRCLSDSLRAMGREDSYVDLQTSKAELLRIYKRGEQRWKMMWSRALRFIYCCQNQTQIQSLLS